jgi:hypothetical protein
VGLGIVCSIIVLIFLLVLGYYVKRAQDKKLDQLGHSTERIEAQLAQLDQRLGDLETRLDEKGSE